MYKLHDIPARRQRMFDAAKEATQEAFPLENEMGRMEVENLHYSRNDIDRNTERDAIKQGESLSVPLRGELVLKDKDGNELDRRSRRIAKVPYLTDRGVYVNNGNNYSISSQVNLKPGIYTRMSNSGKAQAPIQTSSGPNMKVELDPVSKDMRLGIGQSSLKLYPLLKELGYDDKTLTEMWGEEVVEANRMNVDSHARTRIAKKLTDDTSMDNLPSRLRQALGEAGLNPRITKVTLGKEYDSLSGEALARTGQELTRMLRGESKPSPRDALYSQMVDTPESQLKEQIRRGRGELARGLWKAMDKKSLDPVKAGVLDNMTSALFYDTGLASPLQDYNPLEGYDYMERLTRGGRGGLSGHAIPEESRYVQPSQAGFIDITRTPESMNIGIDMRASKDVGVDDEGNLTTPMINAKTGEEETVNSKDLMDLTISWPDQMDEDSPFAVVGGRDMEYVDKDDVDYFIPDDHSAHSGMTRLTPMLTTQNAGRALMSAKFATQAIPTLNREAPLVRAENVGGGTVEEEMGMSAGAERSPVSGRVLSVNEEEGFIEVAYGEGEDETETIDLYRNLPLNRKTEFNQEPLVQPGDTVQEGDVVAASNYTDEEGNLALGANLNAAFLPRQENYEDAILLSRSGAKKLSSRLLKNKSLSTEDDIEVGKPRFLSEVPDKYDREQMQKIDDDGAIKVGEKVKHGDPLILGVGDPTKNPYYYQLRKTTPHGTDESVQWKSKYPGRVADVVKKDNGVEVFVETDKPVEVGDKVASRFGGKGIATVVDNKEMPRDENENPLDMVISSLAIQSRRNPGLAEEAMYGKLAQHRGEPISLPLSAKSHDEESAIDRVKREMKEEGVSAEETLYDPVENREIEDVLTGPIYTYRLTQTSDDKGKSRGYASHSSEGTPTTGGSEGGKKIGRQPLQALLSHGAYDVIEEAQKLKGTDNPEVWHSLKLGEDVHMPDIPYANRKFFDLLKGAGVDVQKQGNNLHIMPMTDSRVEEMSVGEVTSSEMLDRKTMRPKPGTGGLFDPQLTGGPGGKDWAHIELPESVPNPQMERPIAHLLDIPIKGVKEVVEGEREVKGKTGPSGLKEALGSIDTERRINSIESDLPDLSKTKRDRRVKELRILKMLNKYDMDPTDMMISKVPVLPPKARPITELPGLDQPVINSANVLYKDLIDFNNAIKGSDLPEGDLQRWKGELYDGVKSVYGLGEPISQASKEKDLEGIMGTVFGDAPKHSYLQSNVFSKPQNMSGLAVISPRNDLELDEVGMPRSLAKDVYKPMVVRELVQEGVEPADAINQIEEETPQYEEALQRAVQERPVIINRAPTLHKTGMMASWPRLTDSDTLEVPPALVGTMGGDFDGDSGRFILQMGISLTGGGNITYTGTQLEWDTFDERRISMPVTDESPVATAQGPIAIDEIPVIEESREETDSGAVVYDVPDGMKVQSMDTETGETMWKKVTKFTIHPDLEMRNVTIGTRTTDTLNVSADESLIVYDDGEIVTMKPDDAEGMMMPQVKGSDGGDNEHIRLEGKYYNHIERMDAPLNKEVGFFLGLMAGNGWVDNTNVTYISNSHPSVFDRVKGLEDIPNSAKDTTYDRVNINGETKEAGRIQVGLPAWVSRALREWFGHGSGEKRLPPQCFFASREHLVGVMEGLWSSDGSVSINRSRSKPQLLVNYSTTSPYLKDQLIYLCRLLGINASSSDAVNEDGVEYYVISLSSVDVKKLVEDDGFTMTCEDKQEKLEEGLSYVDPTSTSAASMDLVPYPSHLHQYFLDVNRENELVTKTGPSAKNRKGYVSREWASRFLPHLKDVDDPEVQDWCRLVENDHVTWKPVKKVSEAPEATAYDITVPDTWTFATANGLIVQDTMMFHVPVTEGAARDAEEKMLPSKNLLSPRHGESVFPPTKEIALGLYAATREDQKQDPKVFETKKDMRQAFERGEIDADTRVRITGEPQNDE